MKAILELFKWPEFKKQVSIFIQMIAKGKEMKNFFAIQSKNGAGTDM